MDKNNAKIKRIDKFETGNWITYVGKINATLRIRLDRFISNGVEILKSMTLMNILFMIVKFLKALVNLGI